MFEQTELLCGFAGMLDWAIRLVFLIAAPAAVGLFMLAGPALTTIFYGGRFDVDETGVQTLIRVPCIGVWTAEIYAMFSLGRADVFAPGDLALQEAAKVLFDLPERPKERELRQMAEAWSPWRGVAARLLWAYYRVDKNREGIR